MCIGSDLLLVRRTLAPHQPVAEHGAVRLAGRFPAQLEGGRGQSFHSEGLHPAGDLDCGDGHTIKNFNYRETIKYLNHRDQETHPKSCTDPDTWKPLNSSGLNTQWENIISIDIIFEKIRFELMSLHHVMSHFNNKHFVSLTVRFGGDPQGGGALSWSHVVVSDDSEAVALVWFQIRNRQFQRLGLRHVHRPLPVTETHCLKIDQTVFYYISMCLFIQFDWIDSINWIILYQ